MKKYILIAALALAPFRAMAADYTIQMVSGSESHPYNFKPARIIIHPGDTIHFINAQDDTHDVMFESVPHNVEETMSPMLDKKGQIWSYTFAVPGTYEYHCHPHEALGMRGTIIVQKS